MSHCPSWQADCAAGSLGAIDCEAGPSSPMLDAPGVSSICRSDESDSSCSSCVEHADWMQTATSATRLGHRAFAPTSRPPIERGGHCLAPVPPCTPAATWRIGAPSECSRSRIGTLPPPAWMRSIRTPVCIPERQACGPTSLATRTHGTVSIGCRRRYCRCCGAPGLQAATAEDRPVPPRDATSVEQMCSPPRDPAVAR